MGMYGYDYYNYGSGVDALETVAGFFAVFALFIGFICIAWAVMAYILQASGLYTIAKRRGIHHAWLAWIPVASDWVLGSISDQYQYVAKKHNTNRRTILLVLEIVMGVLYGLCCYVVPAFTAAMETTGAAIGAAAGIFVLGWLAVVGISIAYAVFYFIALYDLYAACDPSNAVVKLVFTIFFSCTLPFFVFFSRKKDLGMPPRKEPTPTIPAVEAPAEEPAAEEPEAPTEEAPAPEQPEVEESRAEEAPQQPEETPEEATPAEELPVETEEKPE